MSILMRLFVVVDMKPFFLKEMEAVYETRAFSRKIVCSHCGRMYMRVHTSGNGHSYYYWKCWMKKDGGVKGCASRSLREDRLEELCCRLLGMEIFNTVKAILTNEKYKGDALMQKTITVDFLQKKTKKNEGEAPQYYVEGNNEAIIDPKVFDLVQVEVEKRNRNGRYCGKHLFSSRIKCADCGAWFGSKLWHSTDKYRRVVYRCNDKYRGMTKCQTPHVTENEVKAAFIEAYNKFLGRRNEIIKNADAVRDMLCDTAELEKEKVLLEEELTRVLEAIQNLISENARMVQDQWEYQKRYTELSEKHEGLKARYDEVVTQIKGRYLKNVRLDEFITEFRKSGKAIKEFDESLFGFMVEYVTVGRNKEFIFTL